MSKLGSLFGMGGGGGGGDDGMDSLRYTAPKEPKARSHAAAGAQMPASISVPGPTAASPAPAPAPAPAAAPRSAVLASGAVRLYRINPATGGYEAHEGGQMLGCVIMGHTTTYQILIYNGQKVPQCTVQLTPTFAYTMRDLYMSFGDAQGNKWSALFDDMEKMTTFVRTLMNCMIHVGMFGDEPHVNVIKAAMPSPNAEEAVLSSGMSAGIYITVYEMADAADANLAMLLAVPPHIEYKPPQDVVKVKIGAGEEPIGGLSDALIGVRKNEKIMLGIPPKFAVRGTLDLSGRKKPSAWLMVEIEVAKMKSDKGEKKEKKKKQEPAEESNPGPASAADSTDRSSLASRYD